ncbi:phosphate ABC transporter permease PstA [Gryllotalpicola ginsengisoli]|uniref:phosphate ABC transporter permease PstA n=1 Tax=Gryllotalpicola ginsengisoli TaxID=444608 RepID=UPI0003B5B398|nr:phosphate ABC transporter permease PstA [Gryllotalpicola ginsengisoli]
MTTATNTGASQRRTSALTTGHLPRFSELIVLGCAAAVSAGVLALFGFSVTGWLVLTAVVYLIVIGVLSGVVEGRRKSTDRVVRGLVVVAFLLALIPLISTLWTVVSRGIGQLSWSFISGTDRTTFDPTTLEVKVVPGALQAIIGTLEITGIATVISVPIGLLTAIWLTEYTQSNNPVRRVITFLVDVMTGIPSIVAGLFAFSLFALIRGPKEAFSGFSASVALCVLMIPIVVRSSEEMIRLVPHELREASYALGVTKWRTIMRVVLRTAVAGLVTGVVLAIARVIGETAPIYIAAGATNRLNTDPFNGPMSTLAVLSYTGYAFPNDQDKAASLLEAWGSALLLVIIVVILNLIARVVATAFSPKARR